MSVTLYFAEEIPLEPKDDAQGMSDSAPLLNGSRDDGCASHEPSDGRIPNGHADGNNVPANSNADDSRDTNSNANSDNSEAFNDGPGAVLVNILTSMRHLPGGMHSVLIVMALTWVCRQITYMHTSYSQKLPFPFILETDRVTFTICLICSCHGFLFSFLIRTGWGVKCTMGIQMETQVKRKLMTMVSEKVHLVCY